MLSPIVVASSNRKKLGEITAILGKAISRLRSQQEFGLQTPPETGNTFTQNAIIKARHACDHTGLMAIGEDSGLEVDLLDGEPGVRSSRYAGENASDTDNLKLLLKRVKDLPAHQLRARFQCVVACVAPSMGLKDQPLITTGVWEGRLLKSPRGENGFGYDPVFFVPEYACTAAEITPAIKNRISHRAQAFKLLRDRLAKPTND